MRHDDLTESYSDLREKIGIAMNFVSTKMCFVHNVRPENHINFSPRPNFIELHPKFNELSNGRYFDIYACF